MTHECEKEKNWGEMEEFKQRALAHIIEAEKEGGSRDRIAKLEVEMKLLMGSGKWFLLAAFVGGLLSNAVPGLANAIFSHLLK